MKTSELIGQALDWAVAKAMGKEVWKAASGRLHLTYRGIYETKVFAPSEKWSQGGPIIEREKIDVGLHWDGSAEWVAGKNILLEAMAYEQRGPTPLIAAMRCYVSSKFGDEIETLEGLK